MMTTRRMMTLTARIAVAACVAISATGCQQPVRDLFDPARSAPTQPADKYDASLLDALLRANVRDGRVNYQHIREHPDSLEAFLEHINFVGPQSQPDLFTTSAARTAYYLNAYNAGAIAAVIAEDDRKPMHDIRRPPLDHSYRFRVDSRIVTLGEIRMLARRAAGEDCRVEFAMCDAAIGSPKLYNQAFDADQLPRQMIRLSQEAVADPQMVLVDHETQQLKVGMAIWSNKPAYIDTYKRETGSESGTVLNSLLHLATPARREYLSRATGFSVHLLPFDRTLNGMSSAQ